MRIRDEFPVGLIALVMALAIIALIAGCEEEQSPTDAGLEPAAVEVPHSIYPDDPVRVRAYIDHNWTPWVIVQDGLALRIPMNNAVALQFKHLTDISSLIGFSYPELDTCFLMPAHVSGTSSWRITYHDEVAGWPTAGRIECRPNETHMSEAPDRRTYLSAELMGETAYLFATQWILLVWSSENTDYEFERSDDGDGEE